MPSGPALGLVCLVEVFDPRRPLPEPDAAPIDPAPTPPALPPSSCTPPPRPLVRDRASAPPSPSRAIAPAPAAWRRGCSSVESRPRAAEPAARARPSHDSPRRLRTPHRSTAPHRTDVSVPRSVTESTVGPHVVPRLGHPKHSRQAPHRPVSVLASTVGKHLVDALRPCRAQSPSTSCPCSVDRSTVGQQLEARGGQSKHTRR